MKVKLPSVDDFKNYDAKTRILGRHGRGHSKSVDMYTSPVTRGVWFEITNHGELAGQAKTLKLAIDIFNGIDPR